MVKDRQLRRHAFFRGYASALAKYSPLAAVLYHTNGPRSRRSDTERIAQDWRAVGSDLWAALKEYDQEQPEA